MAAAVAVPLITAGIGAVTSGAIAYEGAKRQNKAARRAAETEIRRGTQQAKQVNQAAALEAQKRANEAARIRGLIRVIAADNGGEGGTYDALLEQADQDQALNLAINEQNRKNQVAAVLSGAEANILALSSHMTNALLDSITGGIGGADAGLRIGGAVNELNDGGAGGGVS